MTLTKLIESLKEVLAIIASGRVEMARLRLREIVIELEAQNQRIKEKNQH